jgi:hypothetical protein
MKKLFEFESYTIEEVESDLEVNYLVHDSTGFICRLVPGYAGFELSPLDKSLDNLPSQELITQLSNFIVENE